MKKLSLKRPSGAKQKTALTKTIKLDKTIPNKEEEVVVTTIVSSESDDEMGRSENCNMQISSNVDEDSNRSNFFDVKDPSLRKLRELIVKATSRETVDVCSLLPQHPEDLAENQSSSKIPDKLNSLKSRLEKTSNLMMKDGELSPFPKPCDRCCHAKELNCKLNPPETDISDVAACTSRNERNGLSAVKNVKRIQNCRTSEAANLEKPHLKHAGSICISNTATREASNQVCKSIPTHLTRTDVRKQTVQLERNTSCSTLTQNSHLMKDRNSNYYALQSRNQTQTSNSTQETSCHKRSILGVKNTGKHSSDSSHSVATNSDLKQKVRIQKTHLKTNDALVPENNAFDVKDSGNSKTKSSGSSLSSSKIMNSSAGSSSILNNTNPSETNSESETRQSEIAVDKLQVQEQNTNQGKSKSNSTSTCITVTETGTNVSRPKQSEVLQSCPLCQISFPKGAGQMEIDRHIATCLSSADDDIVW